MRSSTNADDVWSPGGWDGLVERQWRARICTRGSNRRGKGLTQRELRAVPAVADGGVRGCELAVESDAGRDRGSGSDRPAQFRYDVVFSLMLASAVLAIAAPRPTWSRAVVLAIEGAALVVAVATARERKDIRYRNAVIVSVAIIILIVLVATGAAPRGFIEAANAAVTAAIPVVIVRGVLRLVRERGVTVEAVAGALAIYIAVGLVFAWIIGFITHVSSTPYFAQHTNGTVGDRVYFSFTVLTTTGFGDFSAATPAGHAIAVIEMLTGQLYLVTVIGVLIGNFMSRRAQT